MDVKLAKPFVDATVNILSTMAMITPTVQKPYLKTTNKALGDVTGIVGVTSQSGHNGVISVTFSKACAIAVVKNLIGEIEDVVQDVQDAVGELTNMISGQARQRLVDMGIHPELSHADSDHGRWAFHHPCDQKEHHGRPFSDRPWSICCRVQFFG